ncbi:MAG: NAD-dependent epimerase/dehydratase family protein [Methylocystaceae bacterium]|nr:NAD-dependent epimerase/dehydratase family protein [Methylocystaceae bacterium]
MRVLVTGGAGFIGSHTVEQLLELGMFVRVLDNLSTGHRKNLPESHPNFEFTHADIRDPKAVLDAMHSMTHCIHLAAQVSVAKSIKDPLVSNGVNILGFLHVLEAAQRQSVVKVVYASSAAVYGMPAYLPLDELAPTCPISPYGLEKLVGEQYAELYLKLHQLPSLGLRYFNVYGPRQDPSSPYSGVISIFMERSKQGLPITIYGDGQQTRDFISVLDVAKVNIAALSSPMTGACNVATGHSVSLLGLVDAVSSLCGHSSVSHSAARKGDITHSSVTPTLMMKGLGVKNFVSLQEGLKQLFE